MRRLALLCTVVGAAQLPPTLPSAHADAFTSVPYAGNPAAVVLLPANGGFPADQWMQKVANEMHLSETAFLVPRGSSSFDLRWFTPTDEVDLCGHATLAASKVLYQVHGADGTLTFHTKSGELKASRDASGAISLDFPAEVARTVDAAEYADALIAAFDLRDASEILWVGRNTIGGPGGGDIFVEVTPEAFGRLAPKPSLIASPGSVLESRVLSVTCAGCPPSIPLPDGAPAASEYDFTSRGFAPCVGVDEDPVCGSAHCGLGPHWAAKLGKTELLARVASPRGGDVHVRVRGERVELGGHAVVTMTGSLLHTKC